MKHVFLITVYKDVDIINQLINRLRTNFFIFVHIDKKSNIKKTDLIISENVYVYKKYKVNWASFNHLKSILFLLEKTVHIKDADYYHILSGQDYPIKSNREIINFFEANKGVNFMDVESVINNVNLKERYQYYWFTNSIDHPKTFDFNNHFLISKFLRVQRKFNLLRNKLGNYPEENLYKGLVYTSLHRDAIKYIFEYVKKYPSFISDLKYCFISEEFFFQTILMNSPLKNTIVNNNLRYIDWSFRDGISPCVLDERDYKKIRNSSCVFVRKISKKSSQLINLLENE